MIQFDTQKAHIMNHQQDLYEQKTAKRIAYQKAYKAMKANTTHETVKAANIAESEFKQANNEVYDLHIWIAGF